MVYYVGQVILLWHMVPGSKNRQTVFVVNREIFVTITQIKTGVLGEHSHKSVSHQSLLGIGDDGKKYWKHWDVWPEDGVHDFLGTWTKRTDSGLSYLSWTPVEANTVYNDLRGDGFYPVDINDEILLPHGNVCYCKKHDRYHYPTQVCSKCKRGK